MGLTGCGGRRSLGWIGVPSSLGVDSGDIHWEKKYKVFQPHVAGQTKVSPAVTSTSATRMTLRNRKGVSTHSRAARERKRSQRQMSINPRTHREEREPSGSVEGAETRLTAGGGPRQISPFTLQTPRKAQELAAAGLGEWGRGRGDTAWESDLRRSWTAPATCPAQAEDGFVFPRR